MTESIEYRNRCRTSASGDYFDADIRVFRYADTPSDVLIDMFQTRKRTFVDGLGWDLPIKGSALEVDQFDHEGASYGVGFKNDTVVLSARILSMGDSMVASLWPEFIKHLPIDSVEVSRMCVHTGKSDMHYNRTALAEMMEKVKPVFAIADDKILRVYSLLGIKPVYTVKHPTQDNIFLAVWT